MAPGRRWFTVYLVAGLGIAVSTIVLIIAAQVGYVGDKDSPFAALGERDVQAAVWLSLWTSTFATTLAMVVAIPSAYALARLRFRGRILVDALLDVPIVLSPVVIGIALILVFRSGPGQWIENHVVRFVFEVPGIVIAQFVLSLAMQVRVLKAGFEEMNPRYEQVARFLGCTPFGAFWRVTLPMCRSSIVAAFVLGWSRALGDFGATVMVAGSVRNKTETIPVAIYNNLASVKIGKALGLAILLTAIALAVLLVVRVIVGRSAR
ncbi:MAG: ABC transporter permease [Deltaproteobacteria bacterium]|nr:ABC transporter permease [Deltaproteobacteria bacterium]